MHCPSSGGPAGKRPSTFISSQPITGLIGQLRLLLMDVNPQKVLDGPEAGHRQPPALGTLPLVPIHGGPWGPGWMEHSTCSQGTHLLVKQISPHSFNTHPGHWATYLQRCGSPLVCVWDRGWQMAGCPTHSLTFSKLCNSLPEGFSCPPEAAFNQEVSKKHPQFPNPLLGQLWRHVSPRVAGQDQAPGTRGNRCDHGTDRKSVV